MTAWLSTCGYFLFALLLGRQIVRAFRPSAGSPVHDWSAAYLAGQLTLTLLTLLTAFVPVSLRTLIIPLGILVVVSEAFGLRAGRAGRPGRVLLGAALFVVLTVLVFPKLAAWHHYLPVLQWDARSIWFFKGKAIYLAGRIETAFFTSPRIAWAHLDYPLHLPIQAAWSSLFLGEWSDYAAKHFLLFNLAAYLRLVFLVLRERGYPAWLSLFLAGFCLSQQTIAYLNGNADAHYIAPLVLAGLALTLPPGKGKLELVVLLLACAANTKREGTFYALLLGAVVLIGWSVRAVKRKSWTDGVTGRRLVWVLVLFVLPLALWFPFRWLNGIEGDIRLAEQVPELASRLRERWGSIVESLLGQYGRLNTPVLIGAVLALLLADLARRLADPAARRRPVVGRAEVLTLIAFAAANGLIVATYALTPKDVVWHLATSARRLLLLPHLLLFLLIVFRLDRFVLPENAAGGAGRSAPAVMHAGDDTARP